MKISFGALDNLDIILLSNERFCHRLLHKFSQIALKYCFVREFAKKVLKIIEDIAILREIFEIQENEKLLFSV